MGTSKKSILHQAYPDLKGLGESKRGKLSIVRDSLIANSIRLAIALPAGTVVLFVRAGCLRWPGFLDNMALEMKGTSKNWYWL
jgi:hypothetical protein